MLKKKALRAIGLLALAFVPVIVLTACSQTASASSPHPSISTTKASYAFTALITAGKTIGKPITGGLNLTITNSKVSGSFHAPENQVTSVTGQATGKQITLSFQDVNDDQLLSGTGKANQSGEYLGTFNLYSSNHTQISSGNWSGLPVAHPENVLAFALRSFITQGPDKGTVYTAAVVIDKHTLSGTFSGPNGDLASVTVVFKDNGEQIIATYAGGAFIDTGHLIDDPAGYSGNVVVSGSTDSGHWVGSFFTF